MRKLCINPSSSFLFPAQCSLLPPPVNSCLSTFFFFFFFLLSLSISRPSHPSIHYTAAGEIDRDGRRRGPTWGKDELPSYTQVIEAFGLQTWNRQVCMYPFIYLSILSMWTESCYIHVYQTYYPPEHRHRLELYIDRYINKHIDP